MTPLVYGSSPLIPALWGIWRNIAKRGEVLERTAHDAGPETSRGTSDSRTAADERDALARDLHAGLAQATTATMLGLEILRTSLNAESAPPPDVIDRLDELATWSGREIRRLMAFLRVPRDRGLNEALRQYVDEIDNPDAPIELSAAGEPSGARAAEAAFRFIHGTLGVLFRKRSTGPTSLTVVSTSDSVTVRIHANVSWPRGSQAIDGIAADAGADPVVVRSTDGRLSIEAVVR